MAKLYLMPLAPDASTRKSLRAFERIHLEPGQTRTVIVYLSERDLSLVDHGDRAVRDGPRHWCTGARGIADDHRVLQVPLQLESSNSRLAAAALVR